MEAADSASHRILLITTNLPLTEVLTRHLRRCGCMVRSVPSMPSAECLLSEQRWDMVVVDGQTRGLMRWIGRACTSGGVGVPVTVMVPPGARLRWRAPWLDEIASPFWPSALAKKLGVALPRARGRRLPSVSAVSHAGA